MTYEMLTGEQPYVGEAPMQVAYQHANDTVPMPSLVAPGVPVELDELVTWATARDPEERPRDARVMLDQLLEVDKTVRPGSDTSMQSTMVLPRTVNASADAETQIMGRGPLTATPTTTALAPPPEDTEPDAADELADTATKRHRRGYWLFALIVVIAALLGTAGWYFGAGPGSQVAVPVLVSATPEDAAAQLEALDLSVESGTAYSLDIPAGLIVSTDPGDGARVDKGTTVTLNVSQGPQPITLPELAGLTPDAATAAITDLGAVPGAVDEIFSNSVDAGLLIYATRDSDGTDLSQGGDAFEGSVINYTVSLGDVTDVTGESLDDAIDLLAEQGLVGQAGEETYSASVPEGDVISAAPGASGPIRAGSPITLTVSRGPEPVEVPDVVGVGWSEAKQTLIDLGFDLSYNPGADAIAALLSVASTDPAAGTSLPLGSTITLKPTNPFG
jgi:beta-lactam-binding protein with PASTA domain